MKEILSEGTRLERPTYCTQEMYSLMLRCWADKPSSRPKFKDVQAYLKGILNQERDSQSQLAIEKTRKTFESIQQSNPGYMPMTPTLSTEDSTEYSMLSHATSYPDNLEN